MVTLCGFEVGHQVRVGLSLIVGGVVDRRGVLGIGVDHVAGDAARADDRRLDLLGGDVLLELGVVEREWRCLPGARAVVLEQIEGEEGHDDVGDASAKLPAPVGGAAGPCWFCCGWLGPAGPAGSGPGRPGPRRPRYPAACRVRSRPGRVPWSAVGAGRSRFLGGGLVFAGHVACLFSGASPVTCPVSSAA